MDGVLTLDGELHISHSNNSALGGTSVRVATAAQLVGTFSIIDHTAFSSPEVLATPVYRPAALDILFEPI